MSSCSQEKQLNTSFEVQPDDMVERHGDGEHNPLERPRASKEDDNMAADGTLQVDQEGDFVFLTEVRMDLETSQVAARHFELAIFRQQQGTISRCKDRGGDYPPHSGRLRGEPENNIDNTYHRLRGGCNQPATSRGDAD